MNSLVVPLSGSLLFALLVVVGIRRKRAQFDLVDYLILVSVVGPVFLFSVLSIWATIFGLCLLLLIGLLVEYFLRFLLKSSKQQYATEPRLNFWSESIETARLASGNYPDDYMSTEFFDQMLRRDELELKLRAVKMWQSTNNEFENIFNPSNMDMNEIVDKYENTKIKPIFLADYGRTFHLIGPAGELWHMMDASTRED